jgi:DNA-binding transcriptional regulator YhcF (GntR family)
MRKQLFSDIADHIQRLIDKDPSWTLPATSQLALTFGVSAFTVQKAIRLLSERGVVRVFQGKKASIVRASMKGAESLIPQSRGSEDFLCAKLREAIRNGDYQVGQELPKLRYFTGTENVSSKTVVRAILRLNAEGLVHKSGKRWIVGPASPHRESPQNQRSLIAAPVVLLVFPRHAAAESFFNAQHLLGFALPFGNALQRFGIRQVMAVQSGSAADQYPGILNGLDEVRAFIQKLGNHYQGAMVHTGTETEHLETWLPELCSSGKPVVYFDSTNEGPSFSRARLHLGDRYFRLYYDEPGAVKEAITTLTACGHQRIGLPVVTRTLLPQLQAGTATLKSTNELLIAAPKITLETHWIGQRVKLAERVAARCTPAPVLIPVEQDEPFWNINASDNVAPISQRISLFFSKKAGRNNASNKDSFRRQLIEYTPTFADLLGRQVTALLCLNDSVAIDYLFWLKAVGIEAPRHLSLVSFGNIVESAMYPISSIDFGFDRLAYLAAHILIGDIPIRSDEGGTIAGKCTCVDRGSVGAPRTGRLPL